MMNRPPKALRVRVIVGGPIAKFQPRPACIAQAYQQASERHDQCANRYSADRVIRCAHVLWRDNMAASKSQPIANEFKLARSAGHDFAGYPAFCGRDLSVRVGVARTLNHNPEQNTP